jgi:hypothetical protein
MRLNLHTGSGYASDEEARVPGRAAAVWEVSDRVRNSVFFRPQEDT